MSFCYCRDCGWNQDDFWDLYGQGWHPFRKDIVEDWVRNIDLVIKGETRIEMDPFWVKEAGIPYRQEEDGRVTISIQNYVAYELERKAHNIKNMHWVTEEDFRKSDHRCPNCRSNNLSVD